MPGLAQGSFAGGEVSPALQGQRELASVGYGLEEATNWFVARTGSLNTRAGTVIVDELPSADPTVRLLKVNFGVDDSVILVLMPGLLRFYTMAGVIVTGDDDPPGWQNGTDYTPGDVVQQSGNHYYCLATHTGATGVNEPTTVGQDTQHWYPLPAFADSSRYQIPHPFTAEDLAEVDISSAGDRITLTRWGYPVQEIVRWTPTRWTLLPSAFRPAIDRPVNLQKVAGGTGTGAVTYRVTAVQKDTLYESAPATLLAGSSTGVIDATAAADPTSPVIIYDVGHGLASGSTIGGISVTPVGAASANENAVLALMGRNWTVEYIDAENFSLVGSEGILTLPAVGPSSWPPMKIKWNVYDLAITFAAPTISDPTSWMLLNWTAVEDAEEYRIYRADNFGEYGLVAKSKYTNWTDFGQSEPDTTLGPPNYRLPFRYNHFPAVSCYWEQRQVFAGFADDPVGVTASAVGDFRNFVTRFPLAQSDSLAFSLPLAEAHRIVGLDVLGGLIVRTTGPVARVTGAGGIVAADTLQVEVAASGGSAPIAAVLAGGLLVYVHRLGSKVFAARWEYDAGGPGGFVATDLTKHAAHLFDGYQITSLEWIEQPEPMLLARRSDGALLTCTLDLERPMVAWTRYTTPGATGWIQDVVAVGEEDQDLPYLLVQRTVDGADTLLLERMAPRTIGYANDDPDQAVLTDSSVVASSAVLASGDITITAAAAWTTLQACNLSGPAGEIASAADEGRVWRLYDSAGNWQDVQLTAYVSPGVGTGFLGPTSDAGGDTPANLQNMTPDSTVELVRQVTGFDHLEGESVTGMADGNVVGPVVVASGVADFSTEIDSTLGLYTGAAVIVAGLPYQPRAKLLRPDWINARGVAGDKLKALSSATLDVGNTRGLLVGVEEGSLAAVETTASVADPTGLMNGLVRAHWGSRWSREHAIILAVDDPTPATVYGIVLEAEVGGR